ncbi:hypothetical protein D0Y65_022716 [Glycine soja]|uniref:WAT1-related protein n=1 Tax=Glycine soja TaxID=3848 RepID=A0A445JPU4_GLYSO|nr:hypothetical protein D0Y65_022716 [Glycine soja]
MAYFLVDDTSSHLFSFIFRCISMNRLGRHTYTHFYMEGNARVEACLSHGVGAATYAYAIFNLVPAITFILSILCGYENLNVRTAAGKAKVLGTILGINGSMLPSFFKGVKINIWNFHINLLHSHLGMQTPKTEWLQGTVTSGFVIIATTGCVRKRGPLYASVFNPLYLVLVA